MSERRIHTYAAFENGLLVNSYLVEADEGVVLIDADLLMSDVRAVAARITALRKPLLGVLVTHAHPDHFNGQPLLAGDDVPVYAAAEVARRHTVLSLGAADLVDQFLDRRRFVGDLVADADSARLGVHKSSPVQFLGDVDTDRDSRLTPFSRHVSARALAAVNALHSDGSQSPINRRAQSAVSKSGRGRRRCHLNHQRQPA
jgi:predicted metal-dependent RNase